MNDIGVELGFPLFRQVRWHAKGLWNSASMRGEAGQGKGDIIKNVNDLIQLQQSKGLPGISYRDAELEIAAHATNPL